ncbi:MAG: hypothetical protein KIT11_07370 [Fimbriimonadaceae bacterium]|nr:hypothetical protein [Fimbriimonadaceae bacterium]QYK56171.1 MAG: hypothetical protein KF733_01560 [Fimbriimonadaceae bacterium]
MNIVQRTLVLAAAAVPWIVASTQVQSIAYPRLPQTPYVYSDAGVRYPAHILGPGVPGSLLIDDNTPANNPITDAGATLGRVLFYETQLSRNGKVSCGSGHQQKSGFSDPERFSRGLNGGLTNRHSMGLADARFYRNGRFFWDERAASLEIQVLMPIQNEVEMDLTVPEAVSRVQALPYYKPLFQAAFGSPEVTSGKMSLAMAQFVRSLVSYRSKFDTAFNANGQPNFQGVFTAQELNGLNIFQGPGQCNRCHVANGQIATQARNNGLDAVTPDGGRFKVPSLRSVELRGAFMHDGRFSTLQQVVEFYNSGVQNNPNLDPIMRGGNGQPRRLNLTQQQKDALVAFLKTLTDQGLLTDPRFSDPFVRPAGERLVTP